jgi:transposase InsO family protein
MLHFLGIPKSNFYRWKHKRMDETEQQLVEEISAICNKHKFCYGYRRIQAALLMDGKVVNHKKVARIMRENRLSAKIRKKRYVYYSPDKRVLKADLINRQFRAEKPNQKWYTDVSVILKGERPLYLSTIIDGCNNEVISNVFSTSPDMKLAFDTIERAVQQRSADGVVLHSDQGGLYTSPRFQAYIKEKNIVQSMSRKGVCYDNVLIESFFSHLKTEVFSSHDLHATNDEIIEKIEEYIHYYNNERIQLKLKKLPPVKYREQFCTA